MSDQDPAKPSVNTSTVPLKKETVRISLRAPMEDSGPVAPKGSTTPVPTAPSPTAQTAPAPTAPPPPAGVSSPPAPRPPGAPPAAPPRPAGAAPAPPAPSPPGAKTIPLAKAPDPLGPTKPVPTAGVAAPPAAPVAASPAPPAAASPIGAKTIPLAKAPGSAGPGPVGRVTTPLQPGGAKPLPQATVKMGSTQPMGAAAAGTKPLPKAPNIQSTAEEVEEEWEEEYEESGLMPFAIIVLVLALVVLGIELITKFGSGS